jgi:hypothetical protein
MTEKKNKYYKHPKYGHVYGDRGVTPFGRAAWPALITPKDPPPPQEGQQPGAPRFELVLLLKKTDLSVKKYKKHIESMKDEMVVLFNKGRSAKMSVEDVFQDGDEFDLEKYPYYKGNYILTARNAKDVNVVDGKKRDIDKNMVEGGNIVCLVVCPMITAHGISYKLEIVQYIKDDGVRFAGSIAPADTYLSIVDGDDEAAEEEEDNEVEDEEDEDEAAEADEETADEVEEEEEEAEKPKAKRAPRKVNKKETTGAKKKVVKGGRKLSNKELALKVL